MKKILFISILLLCLQFAAGEPNYYLKDNLNINLEVGNKITVVPLEENYDIQNLRVYLSFLPMEDHRQKVQYTNTIPVAEKINGELIFEWKAVNSEMLAFKLNSGITTHNELQKIRNSPPFPLKENYEEQYLKETDSVDFKNKEIRELASSIAAGQDNEYEVVHSLAKWVNENIEYSLDTTTTQASQKASWVLENRRGVCDELTNLFIGMCRSVGIPARFVSGISYTTDARFSDQWSSHGWAEVYFPGEGWIPFDVTYGEFGYVDPTHIKLKVADDANKSSTRYEWEAKSATIETGKLRINTNIENFGPNVEPLLEINTNIGKDKTDFGSYNVVEVNVKNPHDYYVPTELSLSKTSEIEMFDEYNQNVLLHPNSEKSFFYIFKISEDLSNNYIYTFKISAKTHRNATDEVSFKGSSEHPMYSLEEIRDYIEAKKVEEEKTYSKNVTLNCASERSQYLVTEVAKINCKVKNTGNTLLEDVNVCFLNNCEKHSFGIAEEKNLKFNHAVNSSGKNKLQVTLEHKNISKQHEVIFDAYNKPSLRVVDIKAPDSIKLDKAFNISFIVEKENDAPIHGVNVKVTGSGIRQDWGMEEIGANGKKFVIHVDKNVLINEENPVFITISYKDSRNRDFFEVEDFKINVEGPTAGQNLRLFVNRLQWDIENNLVNAIIIAIGSVIVAVLVLKWLFRPPRKGGF